jgi:hypothetical protein
MKQVEVNFKDIHLVISIPTYDGKVPVDWLPEFAQLLRKCDDLGIQLTVIYQKYGALIQSNRNYAIKALRDLKADYLLQIDSDILFNCDMVLNLLAKAKIRDADVIAAPYVKKQDTPSFIVSAIDYKPDELGLIRAKSLGTGFFMCSRRIVEKLVEATPDKKYTDPRFGEMHGLFEVVIQNGEQIGEDIWFCRLARQHGAEIWVDTTVQLGHIGNKVYQFPFLTALEQNKPITVKES